MAAREELLKKFKYNTGTQEDNLAYFFLEANGWNLEKAQEMFYESVDDDSGAEDELEVNAQNVYQTNENKQQRERGSEKHEEDDEQRENNVEEGDLIEAPTREKKAEKKSRRKGVGRPTTPPVLREEVVGESKVWFNPKYNPDYVIRKSFF